jgi:hypothetical protein
MPPTPPRRSQACRDDGPKKPQHRAGLRHPAGMRGRGAPAGGCSPGPWACQRAAQRPRPACPRATRLRTRRCAPTRTCTYGRARGPRGSAPRPPALGGADVRAADWGALRPAGGSRHGSPRPRAAHGARRAARGAPAAGHDAWAPPPAPPPPRRPRPRGPPAPVCSSGCASCGPWGEAHPAPAARRRPWTCHSDRPGTQPEPY